MYGAAASPCRGGGEKVGDHDSVGMYDESHQFVTSYRSASRGRRPQVYFSVISAYGEV